MHGVQEVIKEKRFVEFCNRSSPFRKLLLESEGAKIAFSVFKSMEAQVEISEVEQERLKHELKSYEQTLKEANGIISRMAVAIMTTDGWQDKNPHLKDVMDCQIVKDWLENPRQ